ncbi:rhodanese-like domain-containing protein [Rhodoferax sp. BAB1]|jgi:rhodanese-related sulfurtransferase|uniref:rhodanese-like domain-containing protein n=1 Tax=Rhodoferax sp. BAB1 TaxID=2741720 RepID=UPI001574F59E|nr:rhodanese-like domain-containing protein [Rhodoferax sp. BAB1]QKO23291.1 rhodanese-like domain-containing protein [Rhodoferax sp. BAB1]
MKHLLPKEAWEFLQQQPTTLFVDVRMEIESLYVGRPPGVINIPWYEYPDLTPDPAGFVAAVEREAGGDKSRPVVLLCRSGKRTLDAGQVLAQAGFSAIYNVLHGFEGDLDDHFKRSTLNGWRFDGLPWEQM